MPNLTHEDDVYILDLGDGENRFNPEWIASVEAAIAEVEAADGPRALVTTSASKFYSNGLDLDWMGAHPDRAKETIDAVHRLFAHLLSLPLITVAAIPGHAFAAGAMFTLAHDFRVMRADRGFWCLPEVDLNMAFPPGWAALIQARLAPQVAHEAMTTGRRYGGADAATAGIVDHAVAEGAVLSTARELGATNAGKAGSTLGQIKSRMYDGALARLNTLG